MSLTNFAALTSEQKIVWSRDVWSAARDQMFSGLEAKGMSATEASALLLPLDKQISEYRFAQVRVIEPKEEFSDTLEFDPAKIRRAIDAGREAVDEQWPVIEALTR